MVSRARRSVDNYNYDNNRNARSFLANFRRSRAPPVLDVKFFLIKSVRLERECGTAEQSSVVATDVVRRGGEKNNGINCFNSSNRLCKSIGSGVVVVEHWQQSYLHPHTHTQKLTQTHKHIYIYICTITLYTYRRALPSPFRRRTLLL